jgi:hypothetical protein
MMRTRIIALAVVFTYVALAAVVGACPDNLGVSAHHAGHQNKPWHSPLCAWACQLSFPDLIQSAHPGESPLARGFGLSETRFFSNPFLPEAVRHARGPPY